MKALLILASCVSLQSCIYYPEMEHSVSQNVPLITEKGEGQVSVSTGTEAIGIQAAYGITNSISAMGSFSDGLNDIIGDGDEMGIASVDDGLRRSGELAVGYYYSITPKVLFEIYGGAERYSRSFGFSVSYPPSSYSFSTNITKPFIQVDMGLLNGKQNGLGLSCKFGALIYDHYSSQGNIFGYFPEDNLTKTIIEPCLTYRFGSKGVMGQFQLGTSFSDIFVSAGIQIRFYDFAKKK